LRENQWKNKPDFEGQEPFSQPKEGD